VFGAPVNGNSSSLSDVFLITNYISNGLSSNLSLKTKLDLKPQSKQELKKIHA